MEEDKNLEQLNENLPTDEINVTPSKIAEDAVSAEKIEPTDTKPSDVIKEIVEVASPGEDDQVTVETGDSSTRSNIDYVKTELEKKESAAPTINVNVDFPEKSQPAQANETTNVTNVNVTNVYKSDEDGSTKDQSSQTKSTETTPSSVSTDQANLKESTASVDRIAVVETPPIASHKVVDSLINSTEQIEKSIEKNQSSLEKESTASNTILSQLEKIQTSTETKNLEVQTTLVDAIDKLAEKENVQTKDLDQVKVQTSELSQAVLNSVLLDKEADTDHGKPAPVISQANDTKLDALSAPSAAMLNFVKSYEESTKEVSNLINQNFYETINSALSEQSSFNYPVEIPVPTTGLTGDIITLTSGYNSGFNDILQAVENNQSQTKNVEEPKEAILGIQKMLVPEIEKVDNSNGESELDDLIWSPPATQALPTDVRVENNEKKIKPALVKDILATPETKKLQELSSVMEQVRSQIESLNETQVTNNQTISTIANTVNTTNSSEVQKLVSRESESPITVKKEEPEKSSSQSNSMSEYYLHAIYDALVSHGIKLRSY